MYTHQPITATSARGQLFMDKEAVAGTAFGSQAERLATTKTLLNNTPV